jgi:hypothetical protein
MHRSVRLLLASVMALLAVGPVLGPAIAYAQIQDGATLTVLRGQVAVISPDGSAVQPAPSGTVVKAGDEIRTLTKTGALITFFAGTEIEMGEDTILVVDQVTKNGSKVDISLKQVLGTTLNRVQSLTDPASSYKIDAGGAVAVVRGTTFLLIGPVPTSAGNISALICMDDCDGRTTFSGCPVSAYTAFGVEVDKGKATTGCETAAVAHTGDYFNAGFEAITTFEQTFTSANDGGHSPGVINLGRDEGQRKADERNERHDRDDDQPQIVASLSPCGIAGGGIAPGGTFLFPGSGSVVEGNAGTTTLNVPVTLFPASTSNVTVNYATGGGTATAGVDYQPASGTLTFPPGTTQLNVPITVIGDTNLEPDEIVIVTLSNASGATLLFPTGTGRIIDDDNPARLTIDNPHVFEGDSGTTNLVYTVTLSRPSTSAVSVNYQTTGGTATAGTDYTAVASPQTLTIPAGASTGTIAISVNGDTTVEPDETVIVTLSNPSPNTTIGAPNGIGTIVDDDGPATLAIADSATHEGCQDTTPLQFTVQLSHPASTAVTVSYATADGTANAGSDYQAASGTLTFAPGQTTRTIDVQVIGDATVEPDETFTVRLTNSSGATISVPTATGTILNDD